MKKLFEWKYAKTQKLSGRKLPNLETFKMYKVQT